MIEIVEEPKEYVNNDLRDVVHALLVDAVWDIGQRCIQLVSEKDPLELIRLTQSSQHILHHQRYPIDHVVEGITSDVIRPKIEQLERRWNLSVAKRIEHSPERVVDPDRRYYLLINPVEGSDNFANALRHRAHERRDGRNPTAFNAQACITIALVDKMDPFHPISTVVYHFLNGQIYSSVNVVGPKGELTPWAYLGKERARVDPHTEMDQEVIPGRDLTFLVADYKFNFRKGIEAFQTALVKYGIEKGNQNVDPTGGQCATASNILQVIDGEGYDGYIDIRALFTDPPETGRHAKLLYTNYIAVSPIAEGFGRMVTDSDGQPHIVPNGFDLSKKGEKQGNMEVTLVIGKKYFFEPNSQYNVIDAIARGKDAALKAWEEYKQRKVT